jgi:SAM-dependent methyltransferase
MALLRGLRRQLAQFALRGGAAAHGDGPSGPNRWVIARTIGEHNIDDALLDRSGRLTVRGWSTVARPAEALAAVGNGQRLHLAATYRTWRGDVAVALGADAAFAGFEAVFLPPTWSGRYGSLRLTLGAAQLLDVDPGLDFDKPHYTALYDTSDVYPRERIYGVGPPAPENAADVLALARRLEGRVLDFGCGSGYLVATLRVEGRDAHGIEVDTPMIREHLHEPARPHVTLTEGGFPLPFADASFDGAIATEVIEHVPDWRTALDELRRVVRKRLIVTVPDASAIPQLAPAHVVPWHLLEASHVNFFSSSSLSAALARRFSRVEILKLGRNEANGIPWFTSVAAIADV